MKVFIILVLVLVFGFFGFNRYQQLEKTKIAAAETARRSAENDRRRSELIARVAEEEKKRQDEEDELIAAEARIKTTEQKKTQDADAEKHRLAAASARNRRRIQKQQELAQKQQELNQLQSQLSSLVTQITNGGSSSSKYLDQRIDRLTKGIAKDEMDEKNLMQQIRATNRNAHLMSCFAHCIQKHHVDCRVQMGGESKRTIHGIYQKICDDPVHRRAKRAPYCKYYDKNAYWFVRFTCDAHRNSWTREKIAEFNTIYKYKREDFIGATARRQLKEVQASLGRKRAELKTLQNQKNNSSSTVQHLQSQRNTLNSQINQMEQEIENLKKEISRI